MITAHTADQLSHNINNTIFPGLQFQPPIELPHNNGFKVPSPLPGSLQEIAWSKLLKIEITNDLGHCTHSCFETGLWSKTRNANGRK